MKGRIFHELDRLDRDPDNSPYLTKLVQATGRSESWISTQAGRIKSLMLHDYSRISVETIDHFFQGILKSFARESGLNSGYQLELDTEKVLNQFVAYIFDQVRKDPQVRKWLIEWVTERMEEGEKWHKLEADLVDTGYELLKEEIIGLLLQPELGGFTAEKIKELQEQTRSIMHRFRTELEQMSSRCRTLLDQLGLAPQDFSYGMAGPVGYLLTMEPSKPPGKRASEALDSPTKWVKKGSAREMEILNHAYETLNSHLRSAVTLFGKNGTDYNTAAAVNRNLFALWFSSSLLEFLQHSTKKSNEILLTLTQPLIQLIIRDNPTPYIYERTGTYIKHFMIDEFQDTSDLQWKNFLPLLENSLAEDGLGLVVGDVKQSLYRWRNSNWKLIHHKAAADLVRFGTDPRDLTQNHRSGSAIIGFNNELFPQIPEFFGRKINQGTFSLSGITEADLDPLKEIYKGAVQQPGIHADHLGLVEMHVLKDDNEDVTWKEQVAVKLPQIVHDILINRGYSQKDILFLVRNNREAGMIAGILNDYRKSHPDQAHARWSFISNDVFRIGSAEIVRILLSVLNYVATGEVFYLQLLSFQLNCFNDPEVMPVPDSDGKSVNNLQAKLEPLRDLDPLEVVDQSVTILNLDQHSESWPYLFQFRDLARQYREKGAGHVRGFLEWWEVSGVKTMLVTEGQNDAMQIMTIHRAKGLSSPVVIIPYCNWTIDHTSRKKPWIWADTSNTPFDGVPKVPVKYGQALDNTWFKDGYRLEKLDAMLDNLNLLYVAFTRAEEILIALCPTTESQLTVGHAVAACLPADPPDGIHRVGDPETRNQRTKEQITGGIDLSGSYAPFKSVNLIKPVNPETDEPRRYGRLVHRVMETIKNEDDVENVLSEMISLGECDPTDRDRIRKTLQALFQKPEIVDWFSGSWAIMNEPGILVPGSGERRPDRFMTRGNESVVVDYKTGTREQTHLQQVDGYLKLIRQMGYPDVKGYLLYLDPPDLVEVKGPGDFFQPSLFGQGV